MRLCGNNEGFTFAGASRHWGALFYCAHIFGCGGSGMSQEGMTILSDKDTLQMIEAFSGFEIMPQNDAVDFEHGFTKLDVDSDKKKHISALVQHVPSIMAAGSLAQSCVVRFPEGLPHALTKLNQGGYSTMIQEGGKFVGSASLYPAVAQAAFLGVFQTMSIASGQYFLSQINSELKVMKLNLDKILEFLYGEKKAELMSEVSFVKYAYQNYGSIMEHETQKTATIGSLQNAKKVAMKDIEFYMSDLDSTVNSKDNSDITALVEKAFQIKESLELSMQLYGMSSVLEIYYAQNHEPRYIKYIEMEISSYIDKCEKRMLSSFSVLSKCLSDHKSRPWGKIDKSSYEKSVGEFVDSLGTGEESALRKSLRSVLQAATQTKEFYLRNDGTVYLRAS